MDLRGMCTYLFVLLVAVGCGQAHHHTAVAFYNCENLFDTQHDAGRLDEDFTPAGKYHYTPAIYNEKLHNITAVLAKMATDDVPEGPALIGLAEIENDNVLNGLVSQPALARRHYRYVWYNSPDKRGVDVALLYNPDAFTVIHSEPLQVELNDSGRRTPTRDILFVHGVLYGDTVSVLVNHWPSRLGGEEETELKRVAAATVCRREISALLQKGDKIIVMGDFNENPADTSITGILKGEADSSRVGNGRLYNPWANLYKHGQGTLIYKQRWYLFDQVMVTDGFLHGHRGYQFDNVELFKPLVATDSHNQNEIVPRRSFAGTYWLHGYSDHFAVLLYLKK